MAKNLAQTGSDATRTNDRQAAFIVCPFAPPYKPGYVERVYCPAVEQAGLRPTIATDVFRASAVVDDIWRLINDASVVVAELTGRNPNVLYELGLSHAARKPVVQVSETIDDVPFDLRHRRTLTYDKNDPDWGSLLVERLSKALTETVAAPTSAVIPAFLVVDEEKTPPSVSAIEKRLSKLEANLAAIEEQGDRSIWGYGRGYADQFQGLAELVEPLLEPHGARITSWKAGAKPGVMEIHIDRNPGVQLPTVLDQWRIVWKVDR